MPNARFPYNSCLLNTSFVFAEYAMITQPPPPPAALHFDITDLRLFVNVAGQASLTRGAAYSFLSVPAASMRMKSLEDALGSQLLYRTKQGVTLTPAGQALLHHAQQILQQVEHLRSDLQDYAEGVKGHIRIFANTTAVTEFLPEILRTYLPEHPHVNIDLQERLNPEIVRAVMDGTTDIGIVAGPSDHRPAGSGLQALHLSTDRLILVTPSGHALARKRRVAFADTLRHDHIGLHEGSTLHSFLKQIVAQLGQTMKVRIQVRSFESMCRMIEANVGIGIVPESAAQRYRHTMRLALVELTDAWSVRERSVLVRGMDTLPVFSRELVEYLLRSMQA